MTRKQEQFARIMLQTLMMKGIPELHAADIVESFCAKLKGLRFTIPAPRE